MAKIIQFKLPLYAECGCGHDLFLLHLHPDSTEDDPEVIAFECAGCREVVPFEPAMVVECELD